MLLDHSVKGEAENDNSPITTGIDAVDSAIRAYNGLGENDPLTKEMLEAVTSLRISATNYSVNREGYMLLDITVNDSERVGGVLERQMSESRYRALLSKAWEGDRMVELYDSATGYTYEQKVDLKDALLAFYIDKTDQETNEKTYVLSEDIVKREANLIVCALVKNGALDRKFLKGNTIDLKKLESLPNLKELVLCGVDMDNSIEGLAVRREDHVAEVLIDATDRFYA